MPPARCAITTWPRCLRHVGAQGVCHAPAPPSYLGKAPQVEHDDPGLLRPVNSSSLRSRVAVGVDVVKSSCVKVGTTTTISVVDDIPVAIEIEGIDLPYGLCSRHQFEDEGPRRLTDRSRYEKSMIRLSLSWFWFKDGTIAVRGEDRETGETNPLSLIGLRAVGGDRRIGAARRTRGVPPGTRPARCSRAERPTRLWHKPWANPGRRAAARLATGREDARGCRHSTTRSRAPPDADPIPPRCRPARQAFMRIARFAPQSGAAGKIRSTEMPTTSCRTRCCGCVGLAWARAGSSDAAPVHHPAGLRHIDIGRNCDPHPRAGAQGENHPSAPPTETPGPEASPKRAPDPPAEWAARDAPCARWSALPEDQQDVAAPANAIEGSQPIGRDFAAEDGPAAGYLTSRWSRRDDGVENRRLACPPTRSWPNFLGSGHGMAGSCELDPRMMRTNRGLLEQGNAVIGPHGLGAGVVGRQRVIPAAETAVLHRQIARPAV